MLLFASLAQAAELPEWHVIPGKSHILFEAQQAGTPVRGEFPKFTAHIRFDPEQLAKSKIRVEVDLASVTTDTPDATRALPDPLWFAVATSPTAVFESGSIRHLSDNNYVMNGMLTLKGRGQEVTVPFVLDEYGKTRARVHGSAIVSRGAFKVGAGEWASPNVVADGVNISVAIEASAR